MSVGSRLQYLWRYAVTSGRPHMLMRNELLNTVSICWMEERFLYRVFTNYTRIDYLRTGGRTGRARWRIDQQLRMDFADLGDAVRFARDHLNTLAVCS